MSKWIADKLHAKSEVIDMALWVAIALAIAGLARAILS